MTRSAQSAVVDGLAAFRGDFQQGVRIYAIREPVFDPGDRHVNVSTPTDGSGRFSMAVKPGKYYFVAYGKGTGTGEHFEPGDYFCFYSGNPVRIKDEAVVHIGFNLIRIPDDGRKTPGATGVEGDILYDGKLLGKSYLYVYRDSSDEFRGMGFHVVPVGPSGKFKVRLPPGKYFFIGRQRQAGGMYGPIRKNDKVGFYYANPVTVVEGQSIMITLEVISRVEMIEEIWFEKESAGAFSLRGIVRDEHGKPRKDIYILLYDNRDTSGKPRFISGKTAEDGSFSMDLYEDGTYYAVGRQNLGGPPEEAEYYGRYEGPDHQALPIELTTQHPESVVNLDVRPFSSWPER